LTSRSKSFDVKDMRLVLICVRTFLGYHIKMDKEKEKEAGEEEEEGGEE
jgi:hypothetical protein